MNEKEFISKIKSLKSEIATSDEFFVSNKKDFLNFVSAEFGLNEKKENNFAKFLERIRIPGLIVGASAFAITAFGFTISYTLKSLPGDPLYSLKLSMENTKVAVTVDDSRNINLQVELTGNRIKELAEVLKSNRPDKEKIASELIEKINNNIGNLPDKVAALNENKKAIENTGKNIDDKLSEYGNKLIESKAIASSSGMNLGREIDRAYVKGNSVAVKTLNIVVQNVDLDNEDLKKDIIDRVEKKVDNINSVVNGIENDIIKESNKNINNNPLDAENQEDENGGASSLANQLQNIKEELKKAKVEIASVNIIDMMDVIDKSLNNSNIDSTPIMTITTPAIEKIEKQDNEEIKEEGEQEKIPFINKEEDVIDNEIQEDLDQVTIQFSGSNNTEENNEISNEDVDFQIQSLWTEVGE